MSDARICWLDQPLPFRRRSGRREDLTPLRITEDHDRDPVVAVETGHPVLDLGFVFLFRDLLQIAMAPEDDEAWLDLWLSPPTAEELARRLEPYHPALMLDHPETPALQVRPCGAPDEGEPLALALLLPDQPSTNELERQRAFFTHAPSVPALGTGLVLPLFYADMVLFPSAGGGYFGLPTGADSIKFTVSGPTLWQRLWANVLAANDPFWPEGTGFPAPCDASVFPWLDPALRTMALGRRDPAGRRTVRARDRHPAAIPMPRRYLLEPAEQGRCALTGIEGPVFRTFRRWPAGLQYEAEGFRVIWAAERERWKRGASQGKRRFLQAKTPLRFDDWLEASLGTVREPPADGGAFERILPAPVVRTAATRADMFEGHSPLRVEAAALLLDGKVPAASAERRQPLYARQVQEELALAARVHRLVEAVLDMAGSLRKAIRDVLADAERGTARALAEELQEALLGALDGEVVAYPAAVVEANRRHPHDEDARERAIAGLELAVLERARKRALELFDEAFPLTVLDATTRRALRARRHLLRALTREVEAFRPRSAP